MRNKKERKRDRRWYLFPVSTLGAVYFAVHGGTGRGFFFEAGRGGGGGFPRRDGAVVVFSEAGRGGFFFFFRRDGTGRCFCFCFEGRDGTVVFGGGNFFGGTGQNRYTVPSKAV